MQCKLRVAQMYPPLGVLRYIQPMQRVPHAHSTHIVFSFSSISKLDAAPHANTQNLKLTSFNCKLISLVFLFRYVSVPISKINAFAFANKIHNSVDERRRLLQFHIPFLPFRRCRRRRDGLLRVSEVGPRAFRDSFYAWMLLRSMSTPFAEPRMCVCVSVTTDDEHDDDCRAKRAAYVTPMLWCLCVCVCWEVGTNARRRPYRRMGGVFFFVFLVRFSRLIQLILSRFFFYLFWGASFIARVCSSVGIVFGLMLSSILSFIYSPEQS